MTKRQNNPEPMRFFTSDSGLFNPIPPIPPMPPQAPFPPGKAFMFNTQTQIQRLSHQIIDDETLVFYYSLPGIDKSSLKLRSKPDKVSISADIQKEYQELYEEEEVNSSHDLLESVNPEMAKASYKDGILKVVFSLVEPAHKVDVSEEG